MAQAGHRSITRRHFVAASAAFPLAAVAPAQIPAPDSVWAAIAAHQAAYAALDRVGHRLSDLEPQIRGRAGGARVTFDEGILGRNSGAYCAGSGAVGAIRFAIAPYAILHRSPPPPPAIHIDRIPGHERAGVGAHEQHQFADLLRF